MFLSDDESKQIPGARKQKIVKVRRDPVPSDFD